MKAIRFLVLVAGLSIFATSCATIPARRLPVVAKAPATNVNKVSLTYSMTTGFEMVKGQRQASVPAAKAKFEEFFVTAMNDSGRFSSVGQGKGGGVHLDVDVLNYGNGRAAMVSGFISGFTLMAIPGAASDNYKLTVTARSASGKTRQYVLDDGMTTVIWLPLIVAAPFSNPVAVAPKVNQNMYRNLLQNLENDGMIPKAILSKTGN